MTGEPHKPVIIFDGECVLCNRFATWVLRRDRDGAFLLTSSNSHAAQDLLTRHGLLGQRTNTIVVVSGGEALTRSDAALFVLQTLGALPLLTRIGRAVPRPVRDALYMMISKLRYRLFGKTSECQLVPPEIRTRLLS
jgi:predicted DCC family thiol-disulfide oxidoreductase YuxK